MLQNTLHSRKQSSRDAAGSHEPQMHVYEVRPRKDHRGVDLISDALPFGRLWYDELHRISPEY